MRYLISLLFLTMFSGAAYAADLQVSPAIVDLAAPQAAATLSLKTSSPLDVQVRVFRWTQSRGAEQLVPTRDVVASPPATRLGPGRDYLLRVVRVSKAPVVGEESYRLLVDQLPKPTKSGSSAVKLLVRHSIPVFFADPESPGAAVRWSVRRSGSDLVVTGENTGARRQRVVALKLDDGAGHVVSFGDGLLGYVLGGASMTWTKPVGAGRFARGRTVTLSIMSSEGRSVERVQVPVR